MGLSNFPLDYMQAVHAQVELVAYQPAYNLLDRDIERSGHLPWCQHRLGPQPLAAVEHLFRPNGELGPGVEQIIQPVREAKLSLAGPKKARDGHASKEDVYFCTITESIYRCPAVGRSVSEKPTRVET